MKTLLYKDGRTVQYSRLIRLQARIHNFYMERGEVRMKILKINRKHVVKVCLFLVFFSISLFCF